jgi:hypothetical protein
LHFLQTHLLFPQCFLVSFFVASTPTNRSAPLRSLPRSSSGAKQQFSAREPRL